MNKLTLLILALTACEYRPARFSDRPPVTRVHDDRPIDVPARDDPFLLEELHEADVYVRREIVNALDPRRAPGALDVNSVDEVPRSSWYRPPQNALRPLADYLRDGAPVGPWELTGETPVSGLPDAEVIVDARGLAYELLPDIEDRPRMRTAAMAISSRLMWALGYYTPEVYIVPNYDGVRVAAVRWPIGRDIGPTPMERRRDDDANDHLAHDDRRTLRALPIFTAWLASGRLRGRMLRDVYVGKPRAGHVKHYVVGLEGTLGVDDYLDALAWAEDPDREEHNFFLRVFSLGLSPKPPAVLPETPFPSIGDFDENVLDKHYKPAPPFLPRDRQEAADFYWAAKRLAALPVGTIAEAIAAAKLEPGAQHWLYQALHLRRAAIIARGFDETTPCEAVTLLPRKGNAPARLLLVDLAVDEGFIRHRKLRYRVRYYDAKGREISDERYVKPRGANVTVPLPAPLAAHEYVVLRVLALRNRVALPRPFEIHLKPAARGNFRLLAVRH